MLEGLNRDWSQLICTGERGSTSLPAKLQGELRVTYVWGSRYGELGVFRANWRLIMDIASP